MGGRGGGRRGEVVKYTREWFLDKSSELMLNLGEEFWLLTGLKKVSNSSFALMELSLVVELCLDQEAGDSRKDLEELLGRCGEVSGVLE